MGINNYNLFCDDFYIDMYINTEIDLVFQRDTILAFFERIQKNFGSMCCFYRRQNNEYCLEDDRESSQYRWVALETERLGSGFVNPASFEDAYSLDKLILEIAPYMLSLSHLDVDSLDVVFAMDFDYRGNHDELIAEALFSTTAFNSLLDIPGSRPIGFSPALVVALSEDCRTQARISIDSKTSVFDPEKQKQSEDESITLSFTIRQYPPVIEKFDLLKSFEYQCGLLEELMAEKIIPNFAKPLSEAIAQKGLK